jgi:hypothetical protein
MFCFRSRRWFVLSLACIPYLVLVQVFWREGSSSINWAQLSTFHVKMETESSLPVVFSDKNKMMDSVQKQNICNMRFVWIPLSPHKVI